MKKTLKITGIVLASLLLILIILPFAFKGKIKDIVISQGNKMLNAEFTMDKLDISFIRNFPNATIIIKDLELWGKDDFAQDTLVRAGSLSATVNLMSLFGSSGYDISRIALNNTSLNVIVLEDGRANWDIMKPSEQIEKQDEQQEPSQFRMEIKRLTMDNIDLTYDDRQAKMYASVENLSFVGSGDLSADETVLKIKTQAEKVGFRNAGVPYLADASVKIDTKLDADLKNMKFTLKDNSLALNAIVASIEGSVTMMENGYDVDLKLNTEKIGFKELLSMIPAMYSKDFKNLKATGDVEVDAWAKGRMVGDDLPAFDASMKVTNGSFRYPALPKGVDNINISATAKNPGGNADLTVIDVNPASLTMGGNPFSGVLHLSTPLSDPAFALRAKGVLNLGMIKEVYPLENMELNGILNADLNLKGRMSYIERNQYDRLAASGSLVITDMLLKMKDMPDVKIHKSTFGFTPQYLNLSETTVTIGKSDITADCKLENYIGFALKKGSIKGNLNIKSNLLDINELMGSGPATETETETESAPMTAPKVPATIDFNMNTTLKKVIYDNITLDNVAGQIIMRDSKLDMRNLSFNTLGGGVVANGYYSTAESVTNPALNAAFKMNQVSFSQTFNTFVTIQKMAPIFENLKGNFSGSVAINTKLDQQMNPITNTLNGNGNISTQNLNLSGVKAIDQIADAIKKPELKNVNVKDLNISFTIKEGRVHTKPFDIKMGDTNLNLSGSTGIDQTIDYTGKVQLPASTGIGKYTSLDLKIGGTFSSPKVSIDTKSMVGQAAQAAGKEAISEIGKKLGIDLSDATKQRETLIAEAQKAGDKLVELAQKEADKLESDAGSNTLKKIGAKAAGKLMVDEAKKQSTSLVKKATEEGDKIIKKVEGGE